MLVGTVHKHFEHLTCGHWLGERSLTRGVTGQNDLCFCALSFLTSRPNALTLKTGAIIMYSLCIDTKKHDPELLHVIVNPPLHTKWLSDCNFLSCDPDWLVQTPAFGCAASLGIAPGVAPRIMVFVLLKSWDAIPSMEFVFREWSFEFRELLRECPGTLRELREWPLHSESVFPEIGVVPRLLNVGPPARNREKKNFKKKRFGLPKKTGKNA